MGAGSSRRTRSNADPTFEQIAADCLALVTDRERVSRFGYSKFDPARRNLADCIPDDHPAVRLLFELHQDNRWLWLCKLHHRNVGAGPERGG